MTGNGNDWHSFYTSSLLLDSSKVLRTKGCGSFMDSWAFHKSMHASESSKTIHITKGYEMNMWFSLSSKLVPKHISHPVESLNRGFTLKKGSLYPHTNFGPMKHILL